MKFAHAHVIDGTLRFYRIDIYKHHIGHKEISKNRVKEKRDGKYIYTVLINNDDKELYTKENREIIAFEKDNLLGDIYYMLYKLNRLPIEIYSRVTVNRGILGYEYISPKYMHKPVYFKGYPYTEFSKSIKEYISSVSDMLGGRYGIMITVNDIGEILNDAICTTEDKKELTTQEVLSILYNECN